MKQFYKTIILLEKIALDQCTLDETRPDRQTKRTESKTNSKSEKRT